MEERSRTRWVILGLLFLISVVNFLDRTNITVAGKPMSETYRLNDLEFGAIYSAFVLGSALFQIPWGWLGDRIGHKKVLTYSLILWSVFTALTPWAGSGFLAPLLGVVPAICVVRFVIGMGEAATFPCANALVGKWFPSAEKARGTSLIFSGIGVGTAVTPPFIAWLMVAFSWQISFYVCAVIGLVLGAIFLAYATELPSEHPGISKAEVAYIEAGSKKSATAAAGPASKTNPWPSIVTNRGVWLLFFSYTFNGYTLFVFFSWFYRYVTDGRGFTPLHGSLLAAFPFLGMMCSAPLGGCLIDRLIPRLGKARARRVVVMTGLLPCLPLVTVGSLAQDNYVSIAALSLAFGLLNLCAGGYWSTAIEILPAHSGTVSAIMNMGTSLSGMLSPVLTPWIKAHYGWPAAWIVTGFCSLMAGLMWKFMGARDSGV